MTDKQKPTSSHEIRPTAKKKNKNIKKDDGQLSFFRGCPLLYAEELIGEGWKQSTASSSDFAKKWQLTDPSPRNFQFPFRVTNGGNGRLRVNM